MFETKMNEGMFSVNCKEHGELDVRAELLLRIVKVKHARDHKRPLVQKITMLEFRCPVCKRYEEYQLNGLVASID
jgi:hypothetical protein